MFLVAAACRVYPFSISSYNSDNILFTIDYYICIKNQHIGVQFYLFRRCGFLCIESTLPVISAQHDYQLIINSHDYSESNVHSGGCILRPGLIDELILLTNQMSDNCLSLIVLSNQAIYFNNWYIILYRAYR